MPRHGGMPARQRTDVEKRGQRENVEIGEGMATAQTLGDSSEGDQALSGIAARLLTPNEID